MQVWHKFPSSSMVEHPAVGSDTVLVLPRKDFMSAKLKDPRLTGGLQVRVLRWEPISF